MPKSTFTDVCVHYSGSNAVKVWEIKCTITFSQDTTEHVYVWPESWDKVAMQSFRHPTMQHSHSNHSHSWTWSSQSSWRDRTLLSGSGRSEVAWVWHPAAVLWHWGFSSPTDCMKREEKEHLYLKGKGGYCPQWAQWVSYAREYLKPQTAFNVSWLH